MLWVTYAPIVTEASDYFKVSEPMVDLLALCYPGTERIFFFPHHICQFFSPRFIFFCEKKVALKKIGQTSQNTQKQTEMTLSLKDQTHL